MLRTTILVVIVTALFAATASLNVVIPKEPVDVRIWLGSSHNSTLEFPELSPTGEYGIPALQAKPNVAVACSGGGMRASMLCMGTMRALHKLQHLRRVRYLTSNSGGGWFNGAFSFQQQSTVGEFLGPYLEPAQASLSALARSGGLPLSFSQTVSKSQFLYQYGANILAGLPYTGLPQVAAWGQAVGNTFQSPHGLNSTLSTVTSSRTRGKVDRRVQEAAERMGAQVYTAMAQAGMPYPIFVWSLVLANSEQVFFPAEYTPLYVGIPAAVSASTATRNIGGYLIEPLGFNGALASPAMVFGPPGTSQMVSINVTSVVPLADAAGVSSAYPAEALHLGKDEGDLARQRSLGQPTFDYWSPHDPVAKTLLWADGGGHDNSALFPLLRRKVKHIVVAMATSHNPTNITTWSDDEALVSRSFGRFPIIQHTDGSTNLPDGISAAAINTAFKVFDESGYEDFWAAITAKFKAGVPVTHRASYDVLENPTMGVPGGWTVDILWILNTKVPSWESKLPLKTQQAIEAQRGGPVRYGSNGLPITEFQDFPLDGGINGGVLSYSEVGVAALSQLRTYVTLSAAKDLSEMFADEQ